MLRILKEIISNSFQKIASRRLNADVDTALDGNLNAPTPCKGKKIHLIRKLKPY